MKNGYGGCHIRRKRFIYVGVIWTVLFAAMSFYWATGGMIGVESLGGSIYQKALDRDPEFIPMVWVTGVVKLLGGIVLVLLLKRNLHPKLKKGISIICIAAGVFMILYGVANFITISLAGLNVLKFDLSNYAIKWRLIFWEPFWVIGGVCYLCSGLVGRRIF